MRRTVRSWRSRAKVAVDAVAISEDDVAAAHAVGLSDNDIADIVFAAAARSFGTLTAVSARTPWLEHAGVGGEAGLPAEVDVEHA